MFIRTKRICLGTIIAFLLIADSAGRGAEDDWVSLFNGHDLTGWRLHGGEKWYVEDGAIVCESTTKKYSYLTTDKTYRDFTLKLQFKAEKLGNSGIFFRSTIDGTNIRGIQFEVDPTPSNLTGGLYETGGRGWLLKPTQESQRAYKPGDWNEIELQAHGNRIVSRMNGVVIADLQDSGTIMKDGVIALQTHEGDDVKVRWKDIMIRRDRK